MCKERIETLRDGSGVSDVREERNCEELRDGSAVFLCLGVYCSYMLVRITMGF